MSRTHDARGNKGRQQYSGMAVKGRSGTRAGRLSQTGRPSEREGVGVSLHRGFIGSAGVQHERSEALGTKCGQDSVVSRPMNYNLDSGAKSTVDDSERGEWGKSGATADR